jgi:putative FmdB family regulatory protein
MPTYEYRCLNCNKQVSIFQTYEEYGKVAVQCPECGEENLQRLISRVRFMRSEESRLESLSDPGAWDGFDEEDPRSMARMMRKMGDELGEEMPPEFDEVVGRLEAGEDPEEIEKSMPDLGAGGDFDMGMGV